MNRTHLSQKNAHIGCIGLLVRPMCAFTKRASVCRKPGWGRGAVCIARSKPTFQGICLAFHIVWRNFAPVND